MNEDAEIKLLMDYVDGTMTGAEQAAFEQRLAADTELRAQADHLQHMRDAVKRYGLGKRVSSIHEEMAKQYRATSPKPGILRSLAGNSLRIAAAVILVLAVIGIYQYASLNASGLYGDLYEPYVAAATRGSGDSAALLKAYAENRNNDVIGIFRAQPEHSAEDYFLAGNAYLKTDNASAAIASFSTLLEKNKETGSHRYQEDAEYYLALSYLKNKEINKAAPLFEKIHNDPAHAYHDKVSSWFIRRIHWLSSKVD